MAKVDFAIGIGGEAGQGIATPGDILARIFARRGLNLNAYNAYQSIIRGGHTFLTIRASDGPVRSMGDKLDVLIPLNQDTMDRHLRLLSAGACVLFDSDKIKPGAAAAGVQLCPLPMKQLTAGNKLAGNTVAIAATLQMLGIEFKALEDALDAHFQTQGRRGRRGERRASRAPVTITRRQISKPFPFKAPNLGKGNAVLTGNMAIGDGRHRGGGEVLRGLSHEPVHRRADVDGQPCAAIGHHGPAGRGRNRRDEHGDRRGAHRLPGDVRHFRRRVCLDDRSRSAWPA